MIAAAENLTFMEKNLPYFVLVTGLAAAGLLLAYFMSESDGRKRLTGTLLAILLVGFSIFCIFEGEGVKQGIDLKGGASFLVRVQPAGDRGVNPATLAQAQAIIEKRLNPNGGKDVTITPQGTDRLYVEVPGLSDKEIAESEQIIERVAKLEFRLTLVNSNNNRPEETTKDDAAIKPGYVKMRLLDKNESEEDKKAAAAPKPERWIWVKNKAELSGKSVAKAFHDLTPGATKYHIVVTLHSEYGEKMEELTGANLQKPMAIVLDGEVLSAPNINGKFGAHFEITGDFSEQQARELSSQLMNPLENPLKVEQKSTISPTYGKATVEQGIRSALVGMGLTLAFMVIYYRLSGIIALIGLSVNLLLLLGAMRVFGQTLTMPGIAGIILTLGMAIDANVLIYERMREEFEAGKDFATAIKSSYAKAFTAIFDSNSTSLITSVIMILIASGSIRGFGLALTIGLVAHMFSALLITRVCFLWLHKFGAKKLSFLHLIKNRDYNFMGKRRICLTVSLIVSLACIGLVAYKGKNALGYELRGGDDISFKDVAGLTVDNVNDALKDWKFNDGASTYDLNSLSIGAVKPLGAAEYIHIRGNHGTAASIKKTLVEKLAAADATKAAAIESSTTESMGSAVGDEMLWRSVIAIIVGLVGIFIYLTFRYEMPFAIGGIVAILHDVTVAVGACVIAGKEIGLILIGAFLTIAGYSINDTIVIFDRVRDNLRNMRGDLEEVLNHAISATLSRTLITTIVTGLAVLAMFLFGGKSMADFSFTMLVGMATGIYSTIFIASPVVLWWAKKRKLNLRQAILDSDAARLEALSNLEREAPAKPVKKQKGDDDQALTPA
jgi:SecD/SecF fusion protein